jgi:hypothetical protein
VYEAGEASTHTIVARLDAIRKIDVLAKAPGPAEEGLVFSQRAHGVGFSSTSD